MPSEAHHGTPHPTSPSTTRTATRSRQREGTHSFESIIARVLHVCCTRVVHLDLLALLRGHGHEERVDASRWGRGRVVLGREWWWRVTIMGGGCW